MQPFSLSSSLIAVSGYISTARRITVYAGPTMADAKMFSGHIGKQYYCEFQSHQVYYYVLSGVREYANFFFLLPLISTTVFKGKRLGNCTQSIPDLFPS